MLDKSKAILVYDVIKELEIEYDSQDSRTLKDIEDCYEDDYILSIWDMEDAENNDGDGWTNFEDFLIDFIEQNIQCEQAKNRLYL